MDENPLRVYNFALPAGVDMGLAHSQSVGSISGLI
jgi:hypothetical protein